jgi:hypothetical protein
MNKKGIEFEYIIAIIILALFFIVVAAWYFGLGQSIQNLIDSIFK